MNCLRLLTCAIFLATLSMTSVLADDCVATAIKSDDGTYQHCEVVHGTDIQFLDTESTPEAACALICAALSETDQVAAESRALDQAAGLDITE